MTGLLFSRTTTCTQTSAKSGLYRFPELLGAGLQALDILVIRVQGCRERCSGHDAADPRSEAGRVRANKRQTPSGAKTGPLQSEDNRSLPASPGHTGDSSAGLYGICSGHNAAASAL